MNEEDLPRWAAEQVKDSAAMLYNYSPTPTTWEECYKKVAEQQFIRRHKLWLKFLELQKENT